jgi:hypothetical protein
VSVAPTAAGKRPVEKMSESGDPGPKGATVRVEDMERALVLAREVAAATAKGGAANLRMEHLLALFSNGSGPPSTARIQAALEGAGLEVEPSLRSGSETVSLRVTRRLSGMDAYQAAAGKKPKPQPSPKPDGVSLVDAQRLVEAEHAQHNTAQAIAALLPATIVPVLAASFLGPLFGVSFAGLTLIGSALLSRPGALADGKMGPIRMPASLARSFLLVSFGIALGALLTSLALIAAGGSDTEPASETTPIQQPEQTAPQPAAPTPEQQRQQQREQQQQEAAERRAARRRAERRRERREPREREQQHQQDEADAPPSGDAEPATPVP